MDPKSRDSQRRAVFAGKAFVAATLAALLAAGCAEADTSGAEQADDAASSESAARAGDLPPAFTRLDRMRLARTTTAPRVIGNLAVGTFDAAAGDAAADEAAAGDHADDATDQASGDVATGSAESDAPDAATADASPDDLTTDGAPPQDDPTSGAGEAEGDEANGDAAACADGADVTPPTAAGLVFTIPADETGMEPISPGDCVEVVDDCDADPIVELLWVTSDEPSDGVAIDDRSPDVTDLGCGVGVRAERAASGDGRVYTLGFRAVDRAGNATQGTCSVVVEAASGVAPVDSGEVYETDLRGLGCP